MPTKAKKAKKTKKEDKKARSGAAKRKSAKSKAGSSKSPARTKQARAAKSGEKTKKTAKTAPTNGKGADEPRARPATREAEAKDKRQLVQERKILRSQSRWLQKALFALSKAEDDQEKLAEVRGEKHEPMAVTVNGNTHELGAVTDSLRDSVMERLEALRVTLRNEHALMG